MTDETTDAKALAETDLKGSCDLIVERAAEMMVKEIGAPMEMMLDRMLTYAGATIAASFGSAEAAHQFRTLANNIEAGCFHPITGEGNRH